MSHNTHLAKDFLVNENEVETYGKGKQHVDLENLMTLFDDRLRDSLAWNPHPYESVQVLLYGWEGHDIT